MTATAAPSPPPALWLAVEDNAAPVAAALFLRAGALDVLRATVSGNYADFFGSGGIYIEDSDLVWMLSWL